MYLWEADQGKPPLFIFNRKLSTTSENFQNDLESVCSLRGLPYNQYIFNSPASYVSDCEHVDFVSMGQSNRPFIMLVKMCLPPSNNACGFEAPVWSEWKRRLLTNVVQGANRCKCGKEKLKCWIVLARITAIVAGMMGERCLNLVLLPFRVGAYVGPKHIWRYFVQQFFWWWWWSNQKLWNRAQHDLPWRIIAYWLLCEQ